MTIDELKRVVAKIQLGDSRQVDRLVLLEWQDNIGHLRFDDAIAAVTLHRQESTDYLMPAHITAGSRRAAVTRERSERIVAQDARRALPAPVITLDMAKLKADTAASIREHRILRGVDPETGKPFEPVVP